MRFGRAVLGAAGFVGFAFVCNKGKQGIRLILDARKTNRLFATPPTVCLLTTKGLCGAEVTGDGLLTGLALAAGDIKDALHLMNSGDDLGAWLMFPYHVSAGELGITGTCFRGKRLRSADIVWLRA